MSQLLKHYFLDRDNPEIFAISSSHYARVKFGTIVPDIEGLSIMYEFIQDDGVKYALSTCPDETIIEESDGIKILTQEEWDLELSEHDRKQEEKRWKIVEKYRNTLLSDTDWMVVKAQESGIELSEEFKQWRQALRDITDLESFPRELPVPPSEVKISIEDVENEFCADCKEVWMINDPIPYGKKDPEWWIMKNLTPPDNVKEYLRSVWPTRVFPWDEE